MITWGRERSNMLSATLAKKLEIPEERLTQWESGKDLPTLAQAQKVANTLYIPLGYLYLEQPPSELAEAHDLRTARNRGSDEFSSDFIETYQSVQLRQQWFREFRLQEGYSELPFVGLFDEFTSLETVASAMSELLEVDRLRKEASNHAQLFSLLVQQAENLGVLVFRSGVVGHNPHRVLSVEEFRGFAIYDTYAPAIFINTKDAKSAQVSSILNELAHIWIGEGGVSNYNLADRPSEKIASVEMRCECIAAEVLVSESLLKHSWCTSLGSIENIQKLSNQFKVSRLVIVIRARDCELVTNDEFRQLYAVEMKCEQSPNNKEKTSSGEANPNLILSMQNGRLFSQALLSHLYEGKVLFREAGHLLGTKKLNEIDNYFLYLSER